MGDANDFVIGHPDGFGEVAQDVARGRAGAADDVHVEMHVDRVGAVVGVSQLAAQAVDAEFRPDLPHGDEMGPAF